MDPEDSGDPDDIADPEDPEEADDTEAPEDPGDPDDTEDPDEIANPEDPRDSDDTLNPEDPDDLRDAGDMAPSAGATRSLPNRFRKEMSLLYDIMAISLAMESPRSGCASAA